VSSYAPPAVLAAFVLVVGATLTVGAQAHETSHDRVAVTMDPAPARLAGVRIRLQRTLGDQLLVENRTGTVLEVLDDSGVAFLRVGPAGAEANLAAPAWYETVSTEGAQIPPAARTGARSRWVRIASDPAWGWFDRRLRAGDVARSDGVGRRARAAARDRWTIPLRFGGVPVALHGRFRAMPPPRGIFIPRLTSSEEPFPGVRVQLMAGRVPGLYLENTSDEPVVVLGADGEPFLRVGPEGTSANVRSPTWQRSGKAEVTTTASPVDAKAEPVWQRQSATPRYSWIEFRAAPPTREPAVGRARGTIGRWEVPLRHGDDGAVIGGEIEWIPTAPPPRPTAMRARTSGEMQHVDPVVRKVR
jgi:hypothetical protein